MCWQFVNVQNDSIGALTRNLWQLIIPFNLPTSNTTAINLIIVYSLTIWWFKALRLTVVYTVAQRSMYGIVLLQQKNN